MALSHRSGGETVSRSAGYCSGFGCPIHGAAEAGTPENSMTEPTDEARDPSRCRRHVGALHPKAHRGGLRPRLRAGRAAEDPEGLRLPARRCADRGRLGTAGRGQNCHRDDPRRGAGRPDRPSRRPMVAAPGPRRRVDHRRRAGAAANVVSATYGLIDANSFYNSVERAFAPELRGLPVMVLGS